MHSTFLYQSHSVIQKTPWLVSVTIHSTCHRRLIWDNLNQFEWICYETTWVRNYLLVYLQVALLVMVTQVALLLGKPEHIGRVWCTFMGSLHLSLKPAVAKPRASSQKLTSALTGSKQTWGLESFITDHWSLMNYLAQERCKED